MAMIDIRNITYSYGRKKRPALSDFSLSLDRGGVVGLLGPNGAGKSTLLYSICGLLIPTKGKITIEGSDVKRRLPSTLSQIYLVPEEISLPDMTLDSFARAYSPFYPNYSDEVLDRCLSVFGISRGLHLNSLSMGQKKKAAISFALACKTPALLMDEPTNGLDIPGKAAFRRLVAETMADDRLILISTHQVRDLDSLLDRVIIMNSSEVLLDSGITEIQERLYFTSTSDRELIDHAILAYPSPAGMDIVMPNDGTHESQINLELLFELAINHKLEFTNR